jgi:uncharacterized protein (DUF1330 family)
MVRGMPTYEGGCHCGRVRFRVSGEPRGVTECNCSICAKKGFLHWIVPPAQFELLSGDEALATYQFNTGTARHRFCRHCGMHPFYVPRSDPDKIDVNVRCLEGVDPARLEIAPFDGRNWEAAMAGPVPWRAPGLALVATMTVRREAEEAFREYERRAAQVMRRYGGAIARTVAVAAPADAATFEEIHVVTFPDAAAFAAYRADPELAAAASLREASIVTATVVIGEEGPVYS